MRRNNSRGLTERQVCVITTFLNMPQFSEDRRLIAADLTRIVTEPTELDRISAASGITPTKLREAAAHFRSIHTPVFDRQALAAYSTELDALFSGVGNNWQRFQERLNQVTTDQINEVSASQNLKADETREDIRVIGSYEPANAEVVNQTRESASEQGRTFDYDRDPGKR